MFVDNCPILPQSSKSPLSQYKTNNYNVRIFVKLCKQSENS
ncbi:hypothetical protein GCWU000324_01369 [Kingella oralis ATCC 51147]|uniref:Uncharacterized protein n=1 Tax=Kingella oralis ATCC 51147 TaxID=629741 RepID=C4GGV0_9NEIS|nr:hypothetical protein GCWU000324_01369 [Kingella oralis ATCC 51147]